jgi:hypothetical protein
MAVKANLTDEQERSLAASAQSLPDEWRVVVQAVTVNGRPGFEVRIVGSRFVNCAAFPADAHPLELAHFLELTKDERS